MVGKFTKVSSNSLSMDAHYKRSDYHEKRGFKVSPAWQYFWRRTDGLKAQCRLCNDKQPPELVLIKTVDSNTAGMLRHLEKEHGIFLSKSPNSGGREARGTEEMEIDEPARNPSTTSRPSALLKQQSKKDFVKLNCI